MRAAPAERLRRLPGDDLIPGSIGSFQHAITIGGPRRAVWPWLAQMGAGTRAGWYSIDRLDNGGRPSAGRIIPDLQQLVPGMTFPAMPGVTEAFTLLAFEPEAFLVLGWLSPAGEPLTTWAFVLEDAGEGATRLIVRVRASARYQFAGLPWWAARPIARVVHFIMQRRQLLGIARRAEALRAA